MLIDLHAHSSGISRCCQIPVEKVIDVAIENNLDGIVLTNHYHKPYINDNNYNAFAKQYIEEYHKAKEYGEKHNFKVFFGLEVTMEKHSYVHLLIYGVNEQFVLDHPMLFDYSQEELYKLVKENNGVLIQAHPYRGNKDMLLNLKYLDGIEINCHPLYEGTHIEKLTKIAKENNLILTCGGDFHADTHRPHCGMYLPNDFKDSLDIANYLKTTSFVTLCVQEVDKKESYKFEYYKEK